MKDTCFVNVGLGYWYPAGSDRLKASLLDKGFPGDLLFWKNVWPGTGFDASCVYNCKAAAFAEAISRGYTTIIWGDCSMKALRSSTRFVGKVKEKGFWLGQSGYNCAQVCTDRQLEYFKITRDEAEKIHDCASGLFGVDITNPVSKQLIERWIEAAKDGAFASARTHAKQSADPRFLFGRQDQSCLSVIAGQLGLKLDNFIEEGKFKWDGDSGQTFHCEGM